MSSYPRNDKYFQSQNQHWCKVCKIFIANNKQSIQLHEQGYNHRFNTKQQLKQAKYERRDKEREEREIEKQLRDIESEATKKFNAVDRIHPPSSYHHQLHPQPQHQHSEPPIGTPYRTSSDNVHYQHRQDSYKADSTRHTVNRTTQHLPNNNGTGQSLGRNDKKAIVKGSDAYAEPHQHHTGDNDNDSDTTRSQNITSKSEENDADTRHTTGTSNAAPPEHDDDDDDDAFMAKFTWQASNDKVLTAEPTPSSSSATVSTASDEYGKKKRKYHDTPLDGSIELSTNFQPNESSGYNGAHHHSGDDDDASGELRREQRKRLMAQAANGSNSQSSSALSNGSGKSGAGIVFKKRSGAGSVNVKPISLKLNSVFGE